MCLWDVQCATCREVVKDVDLTDEQTIVWHFCPTCNKETEMIRLPGGHFGNANQIKIDREKK